jgi:uncharacterized protein (DUF2336 family)
MPLTDGTVSPVRTLDVPADMRRELERLGAKARETQSIIDRRKRNEAIVRWHDRQGDGWLSEIARLAGISRVQAGRIVRAAAEAQETGGEPLPTRRYYQ